MTAADIAVFATVIGSIIVFGTAAVLAMGWAFRTGQFDNFQQGSLSIFGPDEPVGEVTDSFPGECSVAGLSEPGRSVDGASDAGPASERPATEELVETR
jgi:nitrogen fixation-related uncharacterized protein